MPRVTLIKPAPGFRRATRLLYTLNGRRATVIRHFTLGYVKNFQHGPRVVISWWRDEPGRYHMVAADGNKNSKRKYKEFGTATLTGNFTHGMMHDAIVALARKSFPSHVGYPVTHPAETTS